MTEDGSEAKSISLSVPIGVVATAIFVTIALVAAYIVSNGQEGDSRLAGFAEKARPRKGLARKFGLLTLVTLIENDTTRKVVVAVLRTIARRA